MFSNKLINVKPAPPPQKKTNVEKYTLELFLKSEKSNMGCLKLPSMMHMIQRVRQNKMIHMSGFESIMLNFKESHQTSLCLTNGSNLHPNKLKCKDGGYGNQF